MSSGRMHDKATHYLSLGILGLSPVLSVFDINPAYGLIVAASEWFGGYYLSPDLDGCSIPSRPFKRWGVLSLYWLPYRQLVPHRHWISHFVIVSSLIRIFYLLVPIEIMANIVFGVSVLALFKTAPMVFLAIFAGIEISCILHLIMDYWIVFKD